MSEGVVTFFEYSKCGFYKVNSDFHEPLEMDVMLRSLIDWYDSRVSFVDTLPWNDSDPGYSRRKKVYLKNVDRDPVTGDYLVTLWRAVGNGDGVYGIPANSHNEETTLYDADDNYKQQLIWGEPSYYWFIPELNIFASIRFRSSIADSDMLNRYLRDFVELQSDVKPKRKVIKEGSKGAYTSVSFSSYIESGNLWFRLYSKQYSKLTSGADLGRIAKEITHFVKRESISARIKQNDSWTRYFSGLPFISNEVSRDNRNVEINIEARPTEKELRVIFDQYTDDYNYKKGQWSNLGFRKDGVGGICWLNEFVVKSSLIVNDTEEEGEDYTGHYTTERLFSAINAKRHMILAPFTSSQDLTDRAKQLEGNL